MNLNHVMAELDELFTHERLGEIPQFLEEHIEQARIEDAKDVLLTLYNESIGFYRETGQYDKSVDSCQRAMALMNEMGLGGTLPYATTLLNIANAYRAAGRLQESLAYYNEVRPIYVARLKEDDMYFAGLYNNLSLLYQEMGDFAAAKEQLQNALEIVSQKKDSEFEVAVTQTNLANTCIELGQDDEARVRAEEAIRIFDEKGVDDAHYSAALSALGSLYYMDKDYKRALEAMEKSRECVEKYLGTENLQYQRLSDNIAIIEEKLAQEKPVESAVVITSQESEISQESKKNTFDDNEIDKILGIDIDNDGWTSVIKADRNGAETKEVETEEEETEEEEALPVEETDTQAFEDTPADSVTGFDISSAFADIKAAATDKLNEHNHAESEEELETEEIETEEIETEELETEGIETEELETEEIMAEEAESEDNTVLDEETAKQPWTEEPQSAQEDEDKAVSAMIAEVMDEIAVEIEEVEEESLIPDITGLELCRRYYEEYGRPMIAEKFPEYESRIATGLAGKGSDCFGFDDMQSRDHDFGPRFVMWVTKEVYDEIGTTLEEEYEKLPDEFMGIKRVETFHGRDRAGVMIIESFYKNILGVDLIGELKNEKKDISAVKSWLAVHDYALATAVNGDVFRDDEGIFTSYRELLKEYYPKAVWYRKIAQACALFSQNGQYNLPRMRKRGQLVSAEIAKAECAKQAMKLYYLLNRQYAPHDKWLFRGMPENHDMVLEEEGMSHRTVTELVEEISLTGVDRNNEKKLTAAIESLAVIFANELERQNIIGNCDLYLDANTAELTSKSDALLAAGMVNAPLITALSLTIAKTEFAAFDKVHNEGGRAGCQNDWQTFKIMRMSQYMTWNEDMLLQYLYEFKKNYADGRNMIEEKYARMMETTAPEEYAQFADRLPVISEQKQEIMEQIVGLQVSWMEEFAQKYPNLAENARTIHTAEDLPYDTSYETYLRGELGTYSDKLLEMYGRYIVEHAKNQKSVVSEIMLNTVRLYGYKSLEDAESRQN